MTIQNLSELYINLEQFLLVSYFVTILLTGPDATRIFLEEFFSFLELYPITDFGSATGRVSSFDVHGVRIIIWNAPHDVITFVKDSLEKILHVSNASEITSFDWIKYLRNRRTYTFYHNEFSVHFRGCSLVEINEICNAIGDLPQEIKDKRFDDTLERMRAEDKIQTEKSWFPYLALGAISLLLVPSIMLISAVSHECLSI